MGFASIALMNVSLSLNSVGFYQITKLTIVPVTLAINYAFYAVSTSSKIKLALAILLAGVGTPPTPTLTPPPPYPDPLPLTPPSSPNTPTSCIIRMMFPTLPLSLRISRKVDLTCSSF